MSESIYLSEALVRQVASFVASFYTTSDEAVDAITAFANAQLTDETPNSLSLAISAICGYSYEVLSLFPSIDIEEEVLSSIERLSEKISDSENISIAQNEVSAWVQDATDQW